MQEIIKQIDTLLRSKFPEYSDQEFQEMVDEYGEIIFLESLNKIFILLPNDEIKTKVSQLLTDGNIDEATIVAKNEGVDIGEIFESISKNVVREMLG